jgi:hypothetical protein
MLLAITFGYVMANSRSVDRYVPLDLISGLRPDIDLFINQKSLKLDLSRTQNIRVRIRVNDLFRSINRVSSFNIVVYEVNDFDRKFISSQNLTIRRDSRPNRVIALDAGYFASPEKNIEIEVFDTAGDLINIYKAMLVATNLDSQILSSDSTNLHGYGCDDSFDDCHIDYLFRKITFEAKPQVQPSTRIIKGEDGLYKVTIPVPRTKFRFLGKRVRRVGGGGGGDINSGFGERLDISIINIGNNFAESQFITYGPNGELNFNDNFFLDLEGKVGIGVNPPQAWLHIRQSDTNSPSLILNPGTLTTLPKDGALEYDGINLYFTVGSTRSVVGSGSSSNGITINNNGMVINNFTSLIFNEGEVNYNKTIINYDQVFQEFFNSVSNYYNQTDLYDNSYITYDNGTVINFSNGSYIEDVIFNGEVFFTDNSSLQINGLLLIPGGLNGQVLTYVNGEALWRDTSAVANGGTSNYYDVTNNYYNGEVSFVDSVVIVDNTDLLFVNGSTITNAILTDTELLGSLSIPGGLNGQVLTYVNGEALWRDTSAVANGGTTTFNNITNVYNNGIILFNQSILTYEDVVQNFYDSVSNYYNQTDLYDNSYITYDNGTVINFSNGSYIEDVIFNGEVFFTDNSSLQINGLLLIPGGLNGQVLTYVNGEALWRDTSAVANGGTSNYYDVTNNYYNGEVSFVDSVVIVDNTDLLFVNGSTITNAILTDTELLGSLSIPGGLNGQVLTYVNGEALWRDTSAVANGGTTTFNNITNVYNNGIILFNQSILTYEDVVQNFYDSVSNYYNQTDLYDNSYITYDNGTVINFSNGSYIEDVIFNGEVFFTDNSSLQINGLLLIPGGLNGQVLTYVNGEALWRDTSAVANGGTSNYYDVTNNYYNGEVSFVDSVVIVDNTDLLFVNGSTITNAILTDTELLGSLSIPGGLNGQVLTYVNGEALWRDTSAVANGGTSYFTDVTNVYNNGNILFNQSTLTYEDTVQNFYDSVSNYYNHTDLYDNSYITYDNGTVINFSNGSYIEDVIFNGEVFFTDNSSLQINGLLLIPGGLNGQVLTYVNGEALWRDTSAVANGGTSNYYDVTNNYYNGEVSFVDSVVIVDNTDLLFVNGSTITNAILTDTELLGSLSIPGGLNGQVLTYVNGEALWRDTSAVANGGTSYFTDVTNVYNNGNILFNQSTLTYEDTVQNFYDSVSNYYNHTDLYDNSYITYDNGTVINFSNGSYIEDVIFNGEVFFTDNSSLQINGLLLIPGGLNGQVLTYVNGEALWRDTSAVANGGTTTFNNITNVYNNGIILFNQSILTYEDVVQNFYDSVSNYYNQTDLYDNSYITYDNGTVINFSNGSYIEDVIFNGEVFFTDNSSLQINGLLLIPGGLNGQVLTYVNGEALWRDTSAVANGGTSNYYDVTNNYYNGEVSFVDSVVIVDNTDLLFVNGSTITNAILTDTELLGSLSIPGGLNGQVLTYVNGEALWRDTSAVANGGTSYFTDVTNVYNNGNILFNQSTLTYEDTVQNFYDSVSNYYNHTDLYDNSYITYDNGTVINFSNGSYIEDVIFNGEVFFTDNSSLQINGLLLIPGGLNGQVLTYVNGEALWRDTSAVANGGTSYFTDVTNVYNNGNILFNQSTLTYEDTVQNFYDSVSNYYNHTDLYDNSYITYDNGTVINFSNGSYIEDLMLNGYILFSNSSTVQINGSLIIPGGAVNGYVLTTDANGVASWEAPSQSNWIDIGTALHPVDSPDTKSIIVGGTSIATADIELNADGGAVFNKQGTGSNFIINNAAAGAFVVSGATGATSIATNGLVGVATLELSDSIADVTFSMLPNGSATGAMFVASPAGLAVTSDQGITINASGTNPEIIVEDGKVSIGNYNGDATLNVNGSLALVGKATQSLAAADSINADSSYVRVVGDGGPVILTSNPQITTTSVQDGQILIIRGINSVNAVTLSEGNGLSLTDGLNFVLGEKDTIQFIYDAVVGEWIELNRSDKL